MATNKTATTDVERGLQLLTPKNRKLNPAAQVRCLYRIGNRAQHHADWLRELAVDRTGAERAETLAEAAEAERKAELALAAMLYLNRTHSLGYPVA